MLTVTGSDWVVGYATCGVIGFICFIGVVVVIVVVVVFAVILVGMMSVDDG